MEDNNPTKILEICVQLSWLVNSNAFNHTYSSQSAKVEYHSVPFSHRLSHLHAHITFLTQSLFLFYMLPILVSPLPPFFSLQGGYMCSIWQRFTTSDYDRSLFHTIPGIMAFGRVSTLGSCFSIFFILVLAFNFPLCTMSFFMQMFLKFIHLIKKISILQTVQPCLIDVNGNRKIIQIR